MPSASDLGRVADVLSSWQQDPWAGHLHPGDLGWHSGVEPDQMAKDLRVWMHGEATVVVGMLDGSDVLRLAVDPALATDRGMAEELAAHLTAPTSDLFTGDDAIVEARGAHALADALRGAGWVDDEPWTPLVLDLSRLDTSRLDRAGLRIVEVGTEAADDWTSVHWSSFKGTPYADDSRARFTQWWTTLVTGPFSDRAHSLVAYDQDSTPVAVTTVWTSEPGRPGLVEPMGVHRDHHGKGYGVAITLAGAVALKTAGASSLAVVAENSNPAAMATYLSSGFSSLGMVTDLRRP